MFQLEQATGPISRLTLKRVSTLAQTSCFSSRRMVAGVFFLSVRSVPIHEHKHGAHIRDILAGFV